MEYPRRSDAAMPVLIGFAAAGVIILAIALFWPSPVQAKPAAMPTRLDLGGVQWIVEQVDYPGDMGSTLGFTRCDTHRIQVKVGLTDARETLLHEMLHAYVCGNGLQGFDVANLYYNSESESKHDGLDAVGYVVEDAISRNPNLASYLAGDGK